MSEIRTNLLSNAAGTGPAGLFKQSAAKAWGLTDTTYTTMMASFNVSSLTDLGTGNPRLNFATAFTSGNNACQASCKASVIARFFATLEVYTSTTVSAAVWREDSAVLVDRETHITVHGDLA
jgi:DNA-binding IclR family transcriptional regulator